MLNNIIDNNIIFLQNHGLKMNSEDDKAVYKYGLQILYLYIIDLFVIFSLAAIFGRLYETIIMTFIFALLQVFGGGYHAKTPLKCLLTMIAGAFIGNILIIMLTADVVFNIILTYAVSGIILILTPVANKKHLVSKKIKHRSKSIIKAAVILVSIAVVILGYLNRNIEVTVISVTLGLYLISLAAAKLKK